MKTSEARIRANQANAALSTGPKTEAGKERSRRNSLKHGMTGAGVVLIEADAAEVERRSAVFADELMAIGEVGTALARCAALNSVRMERSADQQTATLYGRVRQAEADFVAPEGVDEEEAATLLDEAVRASMFDPSPEATLARRYEAEAQRSFFRAVKELRQMERQAEVFLKAEKEASVDAVMASILAANREGQEVDAELDAMEARLDRMRPLHPANSPYSPATDLGVDVPITIGRPR